MTGSALNSELVAAIEAGVCVLTATQQSAHWLKLRYARHAIAQGRHTWLTPDIQSFNGFVVNLWRAHARGPERVLPTEQGRLVWERIVTASTWSERLLSPLAAANASFRSWERLQAWRIGREMLGEQVERVGSDEVRALFEWSEKFAAQCRERGWLPAQLLPQRLLELDIRVERFAVLTEDWLPNQLTLMAHLERCGAHRDTVRTPTESGVIAVRACESELAELQCAASWAREQLALGKRSVAIVVPELDERAPQARRVFADAFAQSTRTSPNSPHTDRLQHEASFAIASYRSLADFPLVRAALDCLQLAVGRAASTLAGGLLRSPFLRGNALESSQRALADKRLRSQVREYCDFVVLERVASFANCPVLAQNLGHAHALRLQEPSRTLPSGHAEHFIALWRVLGWPGDHSPDSDEQQVTARLQEALAEFGALDELLGSLGFAAAVREFEQLVRNVSFEPRGAASPITIVDTQQVDGLNFDAAWVMGMDESRWPPPAAPDAFIPVSLQIQVGMQNATASMSRERARERFERLKCIAPQVILSWGRKDQEIDVLPSPWLREIGAATQMEVIDESYATLVFAHAPTLAMVTEPAAPSVDQAHVRGGARIFELQSLCPFRAFAELRLGAHPLDQVAPSIDARDRGTLVHAAFAEIWATLGGSQGLHARSSEQLAVLVRTALARHVAKLQDGASSHRVRMLQIETEIAAERMLTLLKLDKERQPFSVVGRPETQETARVGELEFELRLDRMDELLDEAHRGERVIVDYKTGNNVKPSSWVSERPEQPQLPLYAVTHPENLAAVAFVTVGAKSVGYQGVARDGDILPSVKEFSSKKLGSNGDWNELLTHWQMVIEKLADEFANGHAAVDPLPSACRYCHLNTVCRVREQVEAGLALLDDGEDQT